MTDPVIAARHAALCERIHALNHAYYVLNQPELTDREYDALVEQLKELETLAPELATPDSPTQRVGAPVPGSTRFEKVTRAVPMLSLENSYNPKEVETFERSVRQYLRPSDAAGDTFKGSLEFILEPKLDGISIECVYEKGRLKLAATRGDGLTGENVTVNVLAIESVPRTLPEALDLTVRGELLLKYSDFRALNDRRRAEGLEPLVNPRNAVGGAIHQLELQKKAVKAARQLSLFEMAEPVEEKKNPITELNLWAVFYEITGDHVRPTQRENLEFLGRLGFQVPASVEVVSSVAQILQVIDRWDRARAALDYPMDGLVIKVNEVALWKMIGRSAKSPRWAIAYKFEPERAVSRLISVDAQVGRTGIITPVANVEPVFVAGTTVARASLHNWAYVREKNLRIGDMVFIEKAGEIIPQIISVDESRERGTEPVTPPRACPSCGFGLRAESITTRQKKNTSRETIDAFLKCPNEEGCLAQIGERIIHFVSRSAMNIDSLGEMIVTRLVTAGHLRSPLDIYGLREEHLLSIEGFAEKSAGQLISAIEKSRTSTLSRFIFAIGINSVGAVNARLLAGHFGSLERFVVFAKATRSCREEEVRKISGIGDKLQEEIVAYFERAWVVRMLEAFLSLGLELSGTGAGEKPLLGKSFCITGRLSKPRSTYVARIQELGGVTRVKPSKNCNYFVKGEDFAQDKVDDFERLKMEGKSGITELNEAELEALLRGEEI